MQKNKVKAAVLLLSGGLDSFTILNLVQKRCVYREVHALSFLYEQRHRVEIDFAQKIASENGLIHHRVINIDLGKFGGSSLTDLSLPIYKTSSSNFIDQAEDFYSQNQRIPTTYVPGRNTIFLSYASSYAETIQTSVVDIYIGANSLDYSGYPDCRPEYIAKFNELIKLGTKESVENSKNIQVLAPLIDMTKAQIVKLGLELGADYSKTISCYDPTQDGLSCGCCDACILRLKGFLANGVPDPARYVKSA